MFSHTMRSSNSVEMLCVHTAAGTWHTKYFVERSKTEILAKIARFSCRIWSSPEGSASRFLVAVENGAITCIGIYQLLGTRHGLPACHWTDVKMASLTVVFDSPYIPRRQSLEH